MLAVGVALPAADGLHQPATAVAPAAVVAMVSMLAVRDRGRDGMVTTLLLPVAATVSFTLAALTHGSTLLARAGVPRVMFVAVYIRRFGPRAFAAGMAAFIGYFLTLVLAAPLAAVPAMAGAAVVGAGAALLARFVLLRERPDKAWQSGMRALRARVHTLLHAIDDVGEEPDRTAAPPGARRAAAAQRDVAVAGTGSTRSTRCPTTRPTTLRRRVLDVELAAGSLVTAVDGLLDEPVDAAARPAVARVTAALDRRPARWTRPRCPETSPTGWTAPGRPRSAWRCAGWRRRRPTSAHGGAARRTTCRTPGAGRGRRRRRGAGRGGRRARTRPAAGLRPTTRTAMQVVVAGALSIAVGGLVVPGQWFWAVITAFVVFAGAASRGELLVRAVVAGRGHAGGTGRRRAWWRAW